MTSSAPRNARRTEHQLVSEIRIDAPVQLVWELVSEVRNAPLWSYQARKVVALGGPTRLGTVSFNFNHRGPVVWPTWARVTDFRPGERFANEIGMANARWVFELEPAGERGDVSGAGDPNSATLLREYRETFYPRGFIAGRIITPAMGGETDYNRFMQVGVSESLEKIKEIAEDPARRSE
ncbi:SRPBCC family protein [Dietzia sp.]|uniref:SRPBCC family protein n=1 Tax=Dietzia sp. TaxID=1871616 RepID=UPI002FDA4B32